MLSGFGRRGTVALIFALSAPMLIAATGLTVDAGYWYERDVSIQSAADAAALAVAGAATKYSITTQTLATSFTASSGQGEAFAIAAANNATNGQFSFGATGSATITVTASNFVTSGTNTTSTWVATATIPRSTLFSAVKGLGITGLAAGNESASGTAKLVQSSSSTCGYFNGVMSVTGGAWLKATNCGIYNGDTACPSTYVSGSGMIMAQGGVLTRASCVATNGGSQRTSTTTGSGYIGTSTAGTTNDGDTSTATLNTSAQSDPVAAMNPLNTLLWNPGWTAPSAPTGLAGPYTPNLGYNTWNQAGVGDCVNIGGSYSAQCELYANWLTGMSSASAASLLMNEGTSNGQTYVTGGLSVQANSTYITLNGNNYYISGGASFTPGSAFTVNGGTTTTSCNGATTYLCFVVNGGLTTTNGTATYANGIFYLTGAGGGPASSTLATGWAMSTNTPTVTFNGSTFYANGGFSLGNGTNQTSIPSGLYEFLAYSGNTSAGCTSAGSCNAAGAFVANNSAVTLGNATAVATHSGAGTCGTAATNTYYFDGGLTMDSGSKYVTLCPGIYYIRNGNFLVGSSVTLTGTGVTIMLQGTAGFDFTGGAVVNLTAPTSNCVDPASYPESGYESPTAPYDGTDGEGICGIAIYQDRNDTASNVVNQGAGSTINGAIYTPSGGLTLSGAGSLSITTTDTSTTKLPDIEATSFTDSGSGNITLTENAAGGGGGGGGASTATALLVN